VAAMAPPVKSNHMIQVESSLITPAATKGCKASCRAGVLGAFPSIPRWDSSLMCVASRGLREVTEPTFRTYREWNDALLTFAFALFGFLAVLMSLGGVCH
jgi:hypothetical protein